MAATEFTIENEVDSTERESTRNKANSAEGNVTTEEVAITVNSMPGDDVVIHDAGPSEQRTTIFFSYSNKDIDWVEGAIKKLESGGNITCLYDVRDFIAGVTIMDNILSCIMKADRTVLVLSPDFLNSPWCGYEAQLTLSEHLARQRKVVIPVLLRGDVIPDFICHLTYLDVQDPRFWEKFMDSLLSDRSSSPEGILCSQRPYTAREEDQFNGKVLFMAPSPQLCRWNEKHVNSLFDLLHTKGIQVDREARQKVMKAMRETGFIVCLCGSVCCSSLITKACLVALLLLVSITLVLLVSTGVAEEEIEPLITPKDKFGGGMIAVIGIIFAILPWIIWVGCSLQFCAIEVSVVREINSVLMDYNLLFGINTRLYTGRHDSFTDI